MCLIFEFQTQEFYNEISLILVLINHSTSENGAFKKLKFYPLKNSHCSKRDYNFEPKNAS